MNNEAKDYANSRKKISEIKPGMHFCSIYKNAQEQFSVVIPYMAEGLKLNQKCVYIVDEQSKEAVIEAFHKFDKDINKYIASNQFVFLTKSESYLKDGCFNADRMIELLKHSEAAALKEGYSALRVTGEMTWSLDKLPGCEQIVEYENKLNYFFPQSKIIAICQYNELRFSPELLLDIIDTHPYIFIYGVGYKNPYFLLPNTFTSRMSDKNINIMEVYQQIRDDIMLWGGVESKK